jgi:hypothetical protein
MTPLERRLERLEAGAGIGVSFPMIFVSFAMGNPPAATATFNGRTWHCAEGEGEAEFLERVGGEARHSWPGGVVVVFLD